METAPDLHLGHANENATNLHENRIIKVGQTQKNDTQNHLKNIHLFAYRHRHERLAGVHFPDVMASPAGKRRRDDLQPDHLDIV